jgi:hypothetical protein
MKHSTAAMREQARIHERLKSLRPRSLRAVRKIGSTPEIAGLITNNARQINCPSQSAMGGASIAPRGPPELVDARPQTRGFSGSVMRLMTPPLPAASRPRKYFLKVSCNDRSPGIRRHPCKGDKPVTCRYPPRLLLFCSAVAIAVATFDTNRAEAQPARGQAQIVTPQSSLERPDDAGTRAHTNVELLVHADGLGSVVPLSPSASAKPEELPPVSAA